MEKHKPGDFFYQFKLQCWGNIAVAL